MNRPVAVRVAVGLGFGLVLGLAVLSRSDSPKTRQLVMSDDIVEPWNRLNGGWWLKANLDKALVVQPDRPHWRGEVEKQHAGADTLKRTRSYRLSTSSQRLRNAEVGPKPPGVVRIVALGDSVTHGWGVARNESYPAQLEIYLRAAGHKVEVINAGVPANRLDTMQNWCERIGVDFDVDWVLWTRRPVPNSQHPTIQYKNTMQACQRATGAKLLVVLPPISTFDFRGAQAYRKEGEHLRAALGPNQPVLELTDTFRAAQKGKGVALVPSGGNLNLIDQVSGEVLLAVPPPGRPARQTAQDPPPPLDAKVYAYFEEHLDVREHLFFDEGHPDAEGFVLFAKEVGDSLIQLFANKNQD
jgi:hypothetical protein